MDVIVNDITYDIPFDLSLITLGKFIEYHDLYGRDLDKQLTELLAKKYEGDEEEIELNRSIDIDIHMDNEGLAWFSFWTDHDLFDIRTHAAIPHMLELYRVMRFLLKETMEDVYELPLSFEWQDEQWLIDDFKVNPSSEMDFNEIITAKEAMRQIYKVGKGKWDGLPYLCAIYLRKKDERFQDEFIHEDGERMTLFKELPLIHALQVAFFLSICVSIWSKTLVSLKSPEEVASLN